MRTFSNTEAKPLSEHMIQPNCDGMQGAKLSQFVWLHPCGPSDSLMALALRYGSDVSTLRRLNNLPLAELSVQSRAKIYIPGELFSWLVACLDSHRLFDDASHKTGCKAVLHPIDVLCLRFNGLCG